MKVYVNYNDGRWRKYKIDFERIANAAAIKCAPGAEVSIILTNDDEIHALNREYRHIDRPTNVLSFELGDDILLGDIYISFDTVQREAAAANISIAEHAAHMVVHGVLHLQGYDHIKNRDAKKMENLEIKILNSLGIKNPYAPDSCTYSDLSVCPGGKILGWFHKIKMRPNAVWQYIVMALLGVVAALGFAPFNMWWATVLAIGVAYKIMIWGKHKNIWRAFLHVLPFSAVYAVAMFWWVTHSIYVVPELAAQFAVWTVPALIGIGIVGGIIFAIPFVVVVRICTFPACRPFLFSATWVFVLWLREWLFTGFPWNPIANIALSAPWISNSMALWGALGLTFVIIGGVASVVELLSHKRDWRVWISFGVFVVLLCGGALYGYKNIQLAQRADNVSPVIRVVQPARSQAQKMSNSRADAVRWATENVRGLIELAGAPGNPDIVVFPETSYPFAIVDGDNMPVAAALQRDVVIGATSVSSTGVYNSMIVATPGGEIEKVYSKSHLVPFGEYRPFGDIIPTPGQLSRGTGPEIINVGDFAFAPAICYEIIFSDSLVPMGESPDAVINITNDTWFGKTPGTYQHLDMVRRYAIESGLPIVRANYSGVSAFIASDGTIMSYIPVARSGYMDGVVYGGHMTAYRAVQRDGVMILILIFSCICTFALSAAYRRK